MKARMNPYAKVCCQRCGRHGHEVWECYAATHADGRALSGWDKPTKRQTYVGNSGVYVLRDEAGRMYVGKSGNIQQRIQQHLAGEGTRFLTGNIKRLPPYQKGDAGDMESWERNETLARMYRHGIDKVRGWMFTGTLLTKTEEEDAFKQICEKFDLCRRCGRNTHFAEKCFATTRADWEGKSVLEQV